MQLYSDDCVYGYERVGRAEYGRTFSGALRCWILNRPG